MRKKSKGKNSAFGGNNPMKMLADLPKIQKAIQISLDEFSEKNIEKEFHAGLVKISSKGEKINDIHMSDELIKMLSEEKEVGQDIIVASITSMNAYINEQRMIKIEEDAKNSGFNPQIVNQIFNNGALSSLM